MDRPPSIISIVNSVVGYLFYNDLMRNSRMKRNVFIILLIPLMVLSAGCSSRTDEINSLEEDAIYRAKLMNGKIMECVNSNDSDGLITLFSKSVRDDVSDLSNQSLEFLKRFENDRIIGFGDPDPYISGAEYAQPMEISGVYDVELESGKHYAMAVWIWAIDDEHPENVGITQIQLRSFSREEAPDDFQWEGRDPNNRGILLLEY